jgi:hypothetical protein
VQWHTSALPLCPRSLTFSHAIEHLARSLLFLAAAATMKMKPTHATGRPRARSDPGVFTPDREDIELQPIDAPIGSSPALSPIEIPTRCSTESMSTDASLDPGHSKCDAETTAPGQCREAIITEPTVGEPTKSAQPDQATQTCMEETVIAQQEDSPAVAIQGIQSACTLVPHRVRFATSGCKPNSAESVTEVLSTRSPAGPSILYSGDETAVFGQ